MTTLFISDIHISDDYPEINNQFLNFVNNVHQDINTIYILGDLFEYWLGDDDPNPTFKEIGEALKKLSKKNISVFFMHGNRDFLIGNNFEERSKIQIIEDPSVIELYGERILISHGDIFCTDDKDYQLFRKQTRDPLWQNKILKKSLEYRKKFALDARASSSKHIQSNNEFIMDAQEAEIIKTFKKYNLTTIIHGHTHRPAIHNSILNGKRCRRIVLGDWYDQGSILKWTEFGPDLIELKRYI